MRTAICSLLDTDSLTYKIKIMISLTVSVTSQLDSHHRHRDICITQPDIVPVPVLYLITLDLVNKLSNCESTCPKRIADVRDEIRNTTDMGDFGNRLLLVGQETLTLYF